MFLALKNKKIIYYTWNIPVFFCSVAQSIHIYAFGVCVAQSIHIYVFGGCVAQSISFNSMFFWGEVKAFLTHLCSFWVWPKVFHTYLSSFRVWPKAFLTHLCSFGCAQSKNWYWKEINHRPYLTYLVILGPYLFWSNFSFEFKFLIKIYNNVYIKI